MYNSGLVILYIIVKTFIIYNLGKNTVIQWRNNFINGIMEKEYVQLYFQHISVNMYVINHICKISL